MTKLKVSGLILWPNGATKQQLSFHAGLLDGPCYTFYPNGASSGYYPMKAGHKNGEVEEYTASGNLISVNTYTDNVQNGKARFQQF